MQRFLYSQTGISAPESRISRQAAWCGLLCVLAVLLTACASEPTATPEQPPGPREPTASAIGSPEPTATPYAGPTQDSTAPPPTATASPEPFATPDAGPTPEPPRPPPTATASPEPTDTAPAAATPAPNPTTEGWLCDDGESVTSIEVGDPTKGELIYQGNTDCFSFQAEAAQTYRIDLSPFPSSAQSSDSPSPLTLYDSGGMQLAGIDQVTEWVAPNSGHYYIAVTTSEIGYYGLTVSPVCLIDNTVQEWTTEAFWRAADLAQVQAVLTNCSAYLLAQPTIKDGTSPLFLAARYNENPAVMQALLEAGANPEAREYYGSGPLLSWAAAYNLNPEVIQVLLDAGVSQDTKDNSLSWAVENTENPAVLQALLDAGADINARNSEGETPLDLAMKEENSSAVQVLKENGASHEKCPTGTEEWEWVDWDFWRPANLVLVQLELECGADVEARDSEGVTPLHFAASISNDPAVIHALVDAGADINARDNKDWTPLHDAAMLNYNPIMKEDLMDIEDIDAELHEEATYYENPAVLLALLDAGANVEARDSNDWTPLHYAAGFNYNPAVLLALLKAGADTDARDSYDVTPLHYAVSGNPNPDVTHALLDASANPDVRDDRGRTPLHEAVAFSSPEVIQTLLDAGTDPNAREKDGKTPLHDASNPAVIQALLDAGADPDAEDNYGKTPLHRRHSLAALQALLDAGASPKAKSNNGSTPLHWAAGSNTEDPAVIRVLLEAGADIRSRDVDGNTPLHWAARNLWYRTTLLQALLDAGADINARNSDGETPLAVAIKNDNQPAVQVLQENGASQ